MSDPQGNFKMRFIGRPGGVLMRGAPGNYIHNKIYTVPYHYSRFPFWELVDGPLELKIPEMSASESVFDDVVYVLDDDAATIEVEPKPSPLEDEEINADPNTDASIEPYMRYSPSSNKLFDISLSSTSDDEVTVSTPEPVEKSREELIGILTEAGVEVKPRTRTATLQKMVDELVSKE